MTSNDHNPIERRDALKMCEYCDKHEGNTPLLDHGTCKAEICYDGCDWMLRVTARQEDRWYGDASEDAEINTCPMCGRELRGDV